jgi:hypothetical protein
VPQSRSGRGGEEKNSQPLTGLEPPIIQPLAQRYTTEPSRLLNTQLSSFYFMVHLYRTKGKEIVIRDRILISLLFVRFSSHNNTIPIPLFSYLKTEVGMQYRVACVGGMVTGGVPSTKRNAAVYLDFLLCK